jgi:hypothetical protein
MGFESHGPTIIFNTVERFLRNPTETSPVILHLQSGRLGLVGSVERIGISTCFQTVSQPGKENEMAFMGPGAGNHIAWQETSLPALTRAWLSRLAKLPSLLIDSWRSGLIPPRCTRKATPLRLFGRIDRDWKPSARCLELREP